MIQRFQGVPSSNVPCAPCSPHEFLPTKTLAYCTTPTISSAPLYIPYIGLVRTRASSVEHRMKNFFAIYRESDVLSTFDPIGQFGHFLSTNLLTTQIHLQGRRVHCIRQNCSLWASTCISLLYHGRCMLGGDANESLGQWGFCFCLCIRVFLFFEFRQFCFAWSDDGGDFDVHEGLTGGHVDSAKDIVPI
jgi:hypothetical protein